MTDDQAWEWFKKRAVKELLARKQIIQRGPSRRGHIERPRTKIGWECYPARGEWVKDVRTGTWRAAQGKFRLEIGRELGTQFFVLYLNEITIAKGLELEQAKENGLKLLELLNNVGGTTGDPGE